jgi:hypothetical protein
VERDRLASDTLSTHGIARGGVVQLAKWGLLDGVLASGAPAVRQVVFRAGDAEEIRTVRARDGVDHLVAPRRYILDSILAEAWVTCPASRVGRLRGGAGDNQRLTLAPGEMEGKPLTVGRATGLVDATTSSVA